MSKLSALNSHKSAVAGSADGTLLLLLGLNLLLLAFFIMLNSMSTHGARHAREVLAQMQAGYTGQEQGRPAGAAQTLVMWKQGVASRVQGVILNRLNLSTLPLETDASRVEVILPLTALFNGHVLTENRVVEHITTAAGRESESTWVLEGPQTDDAETAARVAAFVAAGAHVQVRLGAQAQVRVLITPGQTTSPDIGADVQNAGQALGGNVRGVQ